LWPKSLASRSPFFAIICHDLTGSESLLYAESSFPGCSEVARATRSSLALLARVSCFTLSLAASSEVALNGTLLNALFLFQQKTAYEM